MTFPIDVHSHHSLPQKGEAIVNCFPDEFVPISGEWYSVGFHPWKISGDISSMKWAVFENIIVHQQVLAVGEAGLDKLIDTPLDVQINIFRRQAVLAEKVGKPMIIHSVRAWNELLCIKREISPLRPWVIHGFRGKAALADDLLRHGFYLSVGDKFQLDALRRIPQDRLLLETDESCLSIHSLYQRVAEVKGCALEELYNSVEHTINKVFFER